MNSVVLLSGGIDSTVLLAERCAAGDECRTITFDYGQRHKREIDAAYKVAHHYNVPHTVVKVPQIFTPNALTDQYEIPQTHADKPDDTVVPARNLVFLSLAAAHGHMFGATCVLFGATRDDWPGYADCRVNFVDAICQATYYGTDCRITVSAPFIAWTKHEVVRLGRQLYAPLALTWSCYEGLAAGPCGRCGACVSREAAMA